MPAPFDRAWPVFDTGFPRTVRWPLNLTRTFQARVSWQWIISHLHSWLWRSPHLLLRWSRHVLYGCWAIVTAIMALAAVTVALTGLVIAWAPIKLTAWLVTIVLVWAGWTPPNGLGRDPTAGMNLAELMAALPPPPPGPDQATPGPVDPCDHNQAHDLYLRTQQDLVGEIRRSNDIAEREATERYRRKRGQS
jgi:hypothetical protein